MLRASTSEPSPTGRPRSSATRTAILGAALDLVATIGYRETTIEGIAKHAGAGKQTIYRWWPSKADVVLEALNEKAAREIPLPDEGNLRADLEAFLAATFAAGRRPGVISVLRALMAEAQLDARFAKVFDQNFLRHGRDVLAQLRRRYPEQCRADSGKLAVDVVFGVLWYRALVGHRNLDHALAHSLVELLAW